MKKTNVSERQEIKASHVQRLNEYIEDLLVNVLKDVLQTTNGVAVGMDVTQASSGAIAVSSGVILVNGLVGELESPGSGSISLTIPGSGTETYTVIAYHEDVEDTPSTGFVLVDVVTRVEQIQTNNTRILGAAKIAVYASGDTITQTDYVTLASITADSSGITAIDETVKEYAAAGAVKQIKDAGTSYSTNLEASSVATAGKILALDETKSIDLDGGSIIANNINAEGKIQEDGNSLIPVGTIQMYAGLTEPAGWLFCNGQAVSRTTYSSLFNSLKTAKTATYSNGGTTITVNDTNGLYIGMKVIGDDFDAGTVISSVAYPDTVYVNQPILSTNSDVQITFYAFGVGDGSTTFNVPNLSGRTPVGAGDGAGLSSRGVGQTGGEESHVLSENEMPSHTHSFDAYGIGYDAGATNTGLGRTDANSPASFWEGYSIGNTGGGEAHNNMQPFTVVNFIIKY